MKIRPSISSARPLRLPSLSRKSSAQERFWHSSDPQVGELSLDQLREIAEIKMPDLNANDIEAAMEIIAGTARSMGVNIEGREPKKEYVITRRH